MIVQSGRRNTNIKVKYPKIEQHGVLFYIEDVVKCPGAWPQTLILISDSSLSIVGMFMKQIVCSLRLIQHCQPPCCHTCQRHHKNCPQSPFIKHAPAPAQPAASCNYTRNKTATVPTTVWREGRLSFPNFMRNKQKLRFLSLQDSNISAGPNCSKNI